MGIKKVLCCCGMGVGSSMMVRINVDKTLKALGIEGVVVEHTSIIDAYPGAADLFVIGKDLESLTDRLDNKIILNNLMDMNEIKEKLSIAFGL